MFASNFADEIKENDTEVVWATPATEALYVTELRITTAKEDFPDTFKALDEKLAAQPEPRMSFYLSALKGARYERNIQFTASNSSKDFFDPPVLARDTPVGWPFSYFIVAFLRTNIGGNEENIYVPAYIPSKPSLNYRIGIYTQVPSKKMMFSLSLIDTDGESLRTFKTGIMAQAKKDNPQYFLIDLPPMQGGLYRMDFQEPNISSIYFYLGETFHAAEQRLLRDLMAHRMEGASRSLGPNYLSLKQYKTGERYVLLTEEVRGLIAKTEQEILSLLAQAKLAALRDYVREKFNEIHLGVRVVENAYSQPGWINNVQFARYDAGSFDTGSIMALEEGEHVYGKIKKILEKLKKVPERITLNLQVVSVPDGANFSIYPQSYPAGGRETPTDNTIENLYRGLYRYLIKRDGYLPVEGKLDLVDQEGSLLTCSLVSVRRGKNSLPCLLKVPSK
jgi:hypothetical protein